MKSGYCATCDRHEEEWVDRRSTHRLQLQCRRNHLRAQDQQSKIHEPHADEEFVCIDVVSWLQEQPDREHCRYERIEEYDIYPCDQPGTEKRLSNFKRVLHPDIYRGVHDDHRNGSRYQGADLCPVDQISDSDCNDHLAGYRKDGLRIPRKHQGDDQSKDRDYDQEQEEHDQ